MMETSRFSAPTHPNVPTREVVGDAREKVSNART